VFAAAMQRLETVGYAIVLHVHDEIVTEVPSGFGSPEEFLQILTTLPDWAKGLPVAANVREGERFCKIKPQPKAESQVESEAEDCRDNASEGSQDCRDNASRESDHQGEDPGRSGYQGYDRDDDNYSSGERPGGRTAAEYIYQRKPYRSPSLGRRRGWKPTGRHSRGKAMNDDAATRAAAAPFDGDDTSRSGGDRGEPAEP
jgi:hypothetical protein